ncbi:hypothetical protein B0H17DRAFT_1146287 [Mycena rosella]|uniref:Uncharacterized protein n=1 Tax=Mycena rosella TaxID=1033263 RepID=A0AAD7CP99_MYCRO|nr:hypothetical protein B0H17DRAFT_1146287 [Mycena rosella]
MTPEPNFSVVFGAHQALTDAFLDRHAFSLASQQSWQTPSIDAGEMTTLKRMNTAHEKISEISQCCDIRRLRIYMSGATEDQNALLLPVFYLNLDPAGIPDEDTFDTDAPLPEIGASVERALLALEALYVTKFPTDIDHPETHALILSTPGVHFMVAKVWPSVHGLVDPKKREIAFSDLRGFLADENAGEPANFAALVDGAGGTLENLAELVVLYVEGLVPVRNTGMHFMAVHFFTGILDFMTTVDTNLGDPDLTDTIPISVCATCLLSKNIVRALSRVMCALSITSSPEAVQQQLQRCCTILGILLCTNPGYHYIPQALDYKILRAFVTYAQDPTSATNYLKVFLVALFPPALVSYPVVSKMHTALTDIAHLVVTESFKASAIYEQWDTFATLARKRITIHSLSGEDTKERLKGPEWDNLVSRVAQSNGHMRLDVIVIAGEDEMRYWAVPFRTNTPMIHEGLQQLASELPAETSAWDSSFIVDRLTPLMLNDPDLLELH